MHQSTCAVCRVLERADKLLAKAEGLAADKVDRATTEELAVAKRKLATSNERKRVLAQIKDDHNFSR